MVEQLTRNERVVGSSPTGGFLYSVFSVNCVMDRLFKIVTVFTVLALTETSISRATPNKISHPTTVPIEMRLDRTAVSLNDTFSLDIALEETVHLRKVDIKIAHDPNILHCLSIHPGIGQSQCVKSTTNIDRNSGTLEFSGSAIPGELISDAQGTICTCTFRALNPGHAQLVWRRFGVITEKSSGHRMRFKLKTPDVVISERRESIASISQPDCFDLFQNYPNPFNSETRISYQLPIHSHVRLRVFNILGQEVRILVDSEHDPGQYTVLWNGQDNGESDVSSGLYVCQMESENFTKTLRMTVLR